MNEQQLIFDLPSRSALLRENFFVAQSNVEAVTVIDNWENRQNKMQMICGPKACGKSHLAAVWAQNRNVSLCHIGDLSEERAADLRMYDDIVIDGCETLSKSEEVNFFHLLNYVKSHGANLLCLSSVPAGLLMIELADLKSRICAMPVVHMQSPCDELIAAVLMKLFVDRQLHIQDQVIEYIIPRIERSFSALNDIVIRIDEIALVNQRAVTIPLIRHLFC